MVSQLIEFLTVNESKMEFQNKDFGKDRSVKYKETTREENEKIRKSLVKIQEKIKKISKNFPKATAAGTRTGSGKINLNTTTC